jgi:hypothetical protein
MRCAACDNVLNKKEVSRKSKLTGEYFDLCDICFGTIEDQVQIVEKEEESSIMIPYKLSDWEIGKGWRPLIKQLIIDLKKMGWDGNITQIKQKFGGLRFYIGAGSLKIFNRIDKAEKESFKICEECGRPGRLRGNSWLMTLCDKHSSKALLKI